MVGVRSLQLAAEVGKLFDEYGLCEWQQRAHLGVGEVVFLAHLHLAEVAEEEVLVDMVVATPEVCLEEFPQRLDAAAGEPSFAAHHPFQLATQHFLLLANHIIVVEHPLVGAAHKALAFCLFHQQHVVARHLFDALPEYLVSILHSFCVF